MGQLDVFDLCQLIGSNLPDPALLARVYDDVVNDLATSEVLCQLTLIDHDAGQDTFDTPADTLTLLGVFYDGVSCSREMRRGLEAVLPNWRERRGVPRSFVVETEGDRRFRLFPTPTSPSAPFIPIHGDLVGRDLPTAAIAVMTTHTARDIPFEYELPVALLVLGRVFQFESAYQDANFAQQCGQLGIDLLTALLAAQHA